VKNHLLSPSDRAYVEEARANTLDKNAYMKLSVLVLLDEGLSQPQVSVFLGIGLGTVNNCKQKYEEESLAKYLDRHYVPYQGRLKDEQLAELEDELEQGLYTTCAQVGHWIKERFGVAYSESAVRSILRKLDFVYKKTGVEPGGINIEEQSAFLAELEPFLAEIEPEKEVVYFLDAVHPQHNTRSDHAWIKRGQDKMLPSNTGRNRININGAMNAHEPEEVLIVEAERINAQCTQALLEKILAQNPDKEQIYLFADNARYYYNATLQEWLSRNPKIQLFHLPPYSPNLNLIERLWKFLRKKVINLHYYPHFDGFRKAVRDFFEHIKQYKEELRSLMAPNFQRFATTPAGP
jgi:transposase